jgi:carbamoyl-phosphate synthase large subunit
LKNKFNILVTGCGGDIGQSIGKILKSHPIASHVIGCDMNEDHAGKFIFDDFVRIPSVYSNEYQASLINIIQQYNVDIIIPTSEPELRFNFDHGIMDVFQNTMILSANKKAMEVGFDKLVTAQFLEAHGLPFPKTEIVAQVKNAQLPLILKSRKGSGSKSLFLVKEKDELDFYTQKFPDYIAQEFINSNNDEYTCGLFRNSSGEIRTISYRRKLIGDSSGFGTVIHNKSIDKLLVVIAEKLQLRGSINVQLRLLNDIPFVFEINPRFSSTVRFRHLMGFEDVIWSIQDRLGLSLQPYEVPVSGRRFYRGYSEYID